MCITLNGNLCVFFGAGYHTEMYLKKTLKTSDPKEYMDGYGHLRHGPSSFMCKKAKHESNASNNDESVHNKRKLKFQLRFFFVLFLCTTRGRCLLLTVLLF